MKDGRKTERLVAIKRVGNQFVAVFNVYDMYGNLLNVVEVGLDTLYKENHNCVNYWRTEEDGKYCFYVNGEAIGDAFDFKEYAETNCNPLLVVERWPLPNNSEGYERIHNVSDDFEDR